MPFCSECGDSYDPGDIYCGCCGVELLISSSEEEAEETCAGCAAPDPEAAFCGLCGKPKSGEPVHPGPPGEYVDYARVGSHGSSPGEYASTRETGTEYGAVRSKPPPSVPRKVLWTSKKAKRASWEPRGSVELAPAAKAPASPQPNRQNPRAKVESGGSSRARVSSGGGGTRASLADFEERRARQKALQEQTDPVYCHMSAHVTDFEVVNKSRGKPDFCQFTVLVQVDDQTWSVRRRGQQFENLATHLKLGARLPIAAPPSGPRSQRFDPKFLSQKRDALDDMIQIAVGGREAIFSSTSRAAKEFVAFMLPTSMSDEKPADFLAPFDMAKW